MQHDPKCRVIVLSMYAEREYVRRALKAGAVGYVVKRSAGKEVVDAIRAAHAGQRYLSARVADVVLEDSSAEEKDDPLARLSAREREVLQLIARGYLYKEIALELGIAAKTVEAHVSAVLRKLQLSNRHQLSRWAVERRLVE
jgi:DNA-binding NarL/FixJ family response regulator